MGFRKNIAELEPYVPGIQPKETGFLKLNTNESPYPPSPRVIEVLRRLDPDFLRLYPDPGSDRLRDAIARMLGVGRENVLAANGSDEALAIVFRSFLGRGDRAVFFYPSYTLFRVLARIQEAECVEIELTEDFNLPEAFYSTAGQLKIIASPNSPTGTHYPLEVIDRVLEECDEMVLVDEAYADFADGDCLPLLKKYPQLILTRTVSKSYGLAGIRVGYALADEDVIAGMLKVKDSYNVNRLSALVAEAALEDGEYLQDTVRRVRAERERLGRELKALGFRVFPSGANFVLARAPSGRAREIYDKLLLRKILIRYFDLPRLSDCLRISLGTREQMDTLLGALKDIVSPPPRK